MNKKIMINLILIIAMIAIFIAMMGVYNTSYGTTTYTYSSTTNTLPENFESLYPGYKSLMDNLITEHPTWTFKLYETGLVWDTVLNNEAVGHGSHAKNLSPANNSSYAGEWICSYCGATPCESGAWYCTSRKGIAYMMDPRNSLNNSDVFQFQELGSTNADTEDIVWQAVSGSFIDNEECVSAILNASSTYGISSLHLVSRIIQEQGKSGSTLGLGITDGDTTYYNLFNIGAYGDSSDKIIANGLNKAKDNGWTSMGAAIIGGAQFIKDNYINKGQNTMYYQKFNVVYQNSLYNHQYMQNVLAAQSEGSKMRSYYISAGKLESNFVFNIPLYLEMSQEPAERPDTGKASNEDIDAPKLEDGELAYVNASALNLRDAPGGNAIGLIYNGDTVSIMEKGTELINGYYWYKISTAIGIGYAASEYLTIPISYKIVDTYLYIAPDTDIDTLGITNNSETLGTGASVTFNETNYTLVILGDVSGDGQITPSDYVKIKNHIMDTTLITDENAIKAADVSGDGEITPSDYVKIKNHIMSVTYISL